MEIELLKQYADSIGAQLNELYSVQILFLCCDLFCLKLFSSIPPADYLAVHAAIYSLLK